MRADDTRNFQWENKGGSGEHCIKFAKTDRVEKERGYVQKDENRMYVRTGNG